METQEIINESTTVSKGYARPSIFDYVDYRAYLQVALQYVQSKNPSYSATAFVKQAGFGENSRGYFNLIINGKRNLSPSTILGFSKTLKLSERESHYFENLVLYNQATTEKEKGHYFERIAKAMRGKNSPAFELLKSQYRYFSNWYLVAIRELVALKNFKEDFDWIAKSLRNQISKREISEAIFDLINLGLLKRNEQGLLIQSNDHVTFTDNSMNYTVVNQLHSQFLDIAKSRLSEDAYQDRSASCVVFATETENFDKIREEIKGFREMIMNKYAVESNNLSTVINLGIQLNHITKVNMSADNN